MGGRFWSRTGRALERWVHPLACLAGMLPEMADEPRPDLNAQLQELFDVIRREESLWRVEERIQRLFGDKFHR